MENGLGGGPPAEVGAEVAQAAPWESGVWTRTFVVDSWLVGPSTKRPATFVDARAVFLPESRATVAWNKFWAMKALLGTSM